MDETPPQGLRPRNMFFLPLAGAVVVACFMALDSHRACAVLFFCLGDVFVRRHSFFFALIIARSIDFFIHNRPRAPVVAFLARFSQEKVPPLVAHLPVGAYMDEIRILRISFLPFPQYRAHPPTVFGLIPSANRSRTAHGLDAACTHLSSACL